MGNYSFGFVYVMTNKAYPGKVKIGESGFLVEDRAKELYTTGVLHPFIVEFRVLSCKRKQLEAEVKKKLSGRRVNKGREFYEVTVKEAVLCVLEAQQKVEGIVNWANSSPYRLKEGDRLLLSMRKGQNLILYAYQNVFDETAKIQSVWQAQSDGDFVELYCIGDPGATTSFGFDEQFSMDTLVPYLNREQTVPNIECNGKERLVSGDRLLWVDDTTPELFSSVLFEATCHCQVVSRTRNPKFENGIPALFNNLILKRPSEELIKASYKVLAMGRPRTWAPRSPGQDTEWAAPAQKRIPEEQWLPLLGKKKGKKKK
jgi:hypothetical protein